MSQWRKMWGSTITGAVLAVAGCSPAPAPARTDSAGPVQDEQGDCVITRRVVDPGLDESVRLLCPGGRWAATRRAGRIEFEIVDGEGGGWRLTRAITGPVVTDGPTGVVVVLTLTKGQRTCEVQSAYIAGDDPTAQTASPGDGCEVFDSRAQTVSA